VWYVDCCGVDSVSIQRMETVSRRSCHSVVSLQDAKRSSWWLVWLIGGICIVLYCVVLSNKPLDRSLPSFGNAT
jgi:hypothetical protein